MLVWTFVAATVALGTADPVASVTVPVILAKVVCEYALPGRSDNSTPRPIMITTLVCDIKQQPPLGASILFPQSSVRARGSCSARVRIAGPAATAIYACRPGN